MSDDLVYEAYRRIIYEVMQNLSGEANNGQIAYLGEYDPRRGRFRIYSGCRRSNRQSGSKINLQKPDYISAPIPFAFKPKLPTQNVPNIPDLPINIPGQDPINNNPDRLELSLLPQPRIIVPEINRLPNRPSPRLGHKILKKLDAPSRIIRPKYPPIFIPQRIFTDHWPIIEWEIEAQKTFSCPHLWIGRYLVQVIMNISSPSQEIILDDLIDENVNLNSLKETKNLGRAVYTGIGHTLIPKKAHGEIYIDFKVGCGEYGGYFYGYFSHDKRSRFQAINSSFWSRLFSLCKELRSRESEGGSEPSTQITGRLGFRIDAEIGLKEGVLCQKLNKYEPGTMSRSSMGSFYLPKRKKPSFRFTPGARRYTINLYLSPEDAKENKPVDKIVNATGFFVCEKDYANEALSFNRVKEDFSGFKKPEELLSGRTFFGSRAELPFRKEILEESLRPFLSQIELSFVEGITPRALDIIGIVKSLISTSNDAGAIYFNTLGMYKKVYGDNAENNNYSNWIQIEVDCRDALKVELKYQSQTLNPREVPGLMDLISIISGSMYPILQSGIRSGMLEPGTAIITGYARCYVRDPDDYVTVIIPKSKYREIIRRWMSGMIPGPIESYLRLAFYNSFVGQIHPELGLVLLSKDLPPAGTQGQLIKIPGEATKLYFETSGGTRIIDFNSDLYARAFG